MFEQAFKNIDDVLPGGSPIQAPLRRSPDNPTVMRGSLNVTALAAALVRMTSPRRGGEVELAHAPVRREHARGCKCASAESDHNSAAKP
jgi:hypothetical protein